MSIDLVVGLDAYAVARESRHASAPDPVAACVLAELAGARGVSIGLRTDRKSGQERDIKVLRAVARTSLQVRIAPTPESVRIVGPVRPDAVVLVPERPESIGHDRGHDLVTGVASVADAASALREAGLDVLVLIDADLEQVKAAHRLGIGGVSLLATRLGAARAPDSEERELDALDRCVRLATKLGMLAQASHGLDVTQLGRLRAIDGLRQVEVGHAIFARATLTGIDRAVRDVRDALG